MEAIYNVTPVLHLKKKNMSIQIYVTDYQGKNAFAPQLFSHSVLH